jgi:hypothetical protein
MPRLYVKKNAIVLFGTLFWTAVAIFAVPLSLQASSWSQLVKSTVLVLIIFALFALLIHKALTCNLANKGDSTKLSTSRLALGSALLCAAVWSVYGVVFYPGLISWDIYVQWHEMSGTLPRSDWHPFFHTCLVWLVTRIWLSPAMIMTAQIVFMSSVVGIAARSLQRIRVPDWIILLAVLFYAFFPLNGFYAVSLWKDISYSISFLWLTVLVIDVVSSDGEALSRRNVFIQFFIALFFIALMRHNGIVPAFGSVAVLFAFYCRSQLKPMLLLIFAVIAAVVLFKGPTLAALGVEVKSKKAAKAQVLVQHVGAILNDEGKITEEEKQFLSNILPIAHWKGGYQVHSCMPLICGKNKQGQPFFNGVFLQDDTNYKQFIAIWAKLTSRHPLSIVKYYVQATELIWRIHAPYGIFVIADEGLTADDLYSGYKPSPPLYEKVGRLGKLLIKLLTGSKYTDWLLYRGALYFWLSIFFLSLTFIRSRKNTVLIAAAPMLLQIATVAAFPLAQDTRYMFPVILTAPLLMALYFSPKFSIPSVVCQQKFR